MMNKRGIPEIRDRLKAIAEETGLEELDDLANEMYRRSPVRKAARRSPTLTRDLAVKIKDYACQHPQDHLQDIAEVFGVNPGRVSESLRI
jgi:hypothetical protein